MVCGQWFSHFNTSNNHLFKIQAPNSRFLHIIPSFMFLTMVPFEIGHGSSTWRTVYLGKSLPTLLLFFIMKENWAFWSHLTSMIVKVKYLICFYKLPITTLFSPIKYCCPIPNNYLYNLYLFLIWVYWNLRHMYVRSTLDAKMLGAPRLTAGWSILMILRDLGQHGKKDYNMDGAELTFSIGWYTLLHQSLSLVAQAPPFGSSDQLMTQELKDWQSPGRGHPGWWSSHAIAVNWSKSLPKWLLNILNITIEYRYNI